jgi:hypothetical protein
MDVSAQQAMAAPAAISTYPGNTTMPVLETGTRVRLKTHSGTRFDGPVIASSEDTIVLVADGSRRTLHAADLFSVATSRGLHRNMLNGALIGAGAGIVFGAIAGAASYTEDEGCPDTTTFCFDLQIFDRSDYTEMGAIGGGTVGLPAGTIIGALIRTEKWHIVSYPAVPVLRVGGRKLSIGARVNL